MSDNEQSFEFTGATVDEAIQDGLDALGLRADEIEVDVIEEGSKGIFGLGARQAVVRIRYKPAGASRTAPTSPEVDLEDEEDEDDQEDAAEADESADEEEGDFPDDGDELAGIVRDTVIELLEKMQVRARVSAALMPEDEHSNRPAVAIDISGDDLNILIGKKAETLEALEYITRLIVSKEVGSSVIVNIDVQGFKKRKEQRLRRIAQSVARQAIETGRRQYLEPMSPADRRIIHMELRDHPQVFTESVGEGDRRKVTINPKP